MKKLTFLLLVTLLAGCTSSSIILYKHNPEGKYKKDWEPLYKVTTTGKGGHEFETPDQYKYKSNTKSASPLKDAVNVNELNIL